MAAALSETRPKSPVLRQGHRSYTDKLWTERRKPDQIQTKAWGGDSHPTRNVVQKLTDGREKQCNDLPNSGKKLLRFKNAWK